MPPPTRSLPPRMTAAAPPSHENHSLVTRSTRPPKLSKL
jgi:hypothetical protein